MDFHLEFTPKPFNKKIVHQDKLFLVGSCFTENIGTKLKQHKFEVLENPHGILFNPVSIATAINAYISNKVYTEADLFYQNEAWNSWDHHSRFSHPEKAVALQMMNEAVTEAHAFLKTANRLLITLGSAFVYRLSNDEVVANCHKVPTDKFNKQLLSVQQVADVLNNMEQQIFGFNPTIDITYTISPVRHLRDGFVENNRSKSALIQAVHQLVDDHEQSTYFPAYELVIDDLRDYRFYAEDMVHPNYSATNYVWEKFISTCIDEPTIKLMKAINIINAAKTHKPFNPTSEQHKKFLTTNLEKTKALKEQFPYIDFEEEMKYFEGI